MVEESIKHPTQLSSKKETPVLDIASLNNEFTYTSKKKQIPSTAVHHAGNEVKVTDDSSTSTHRSTFLAADSTFVLPTKYITYTKTSTVTITKTTVVTKSGAPSTMTILLTKTETSTIVDTVTEVHTLVKPTKIKEIITTTVQSSLYPPNLYGSIYPSIQVNIGESAANESS